MRVYLWPAFDGQRLHAPAPAVWPFGWWWSVSAPCRNTPLHGAFSWSGHTESVTALLEKGADVNAEDKYKCAFSCGLRLTGEGYTRRRRLCGRSTRG